MNNNEFNKLNVPEFSQAPHESQPSLENVAPAESTPNLENPPPKEWAERKSDYTPNKKSKKTSLQSLLPKMIALLATTTTVWASTVISTENKKINVEFLTLGAYATEIYYEVQIGNTDEDLWLYLENDFTSRKKPLENGISEGVFEGLVPDMQYSLCVRRANGIIANIDKKTIKTLKQDEPKVEDPVSEFYGFTVTPAESVDGTLTISPSFKDGKGLWSNVSIVLTDSAIVEWPEDIPNLTVEGVESGGTYTMNLSQSTFFTSRGTLTAYADLLLEDGQTQRQAIYTQQVDILSKKTYVESVTVTPAEEPGGEVVVELTYIDENGLWADGELTLCLNGSTEGEAYQAYITEQSSVTTFNLYSGFIDGNMGEIELNFYKNVENDYYSVFLLLEDYVVKGENFVDEDIPNDSTGGTSTGSTSTGGTSTGGISTGGGDSNDETLTQFYSIEVTPAESIYDELTIMPIFEDWQNIWSNVSITLTDSIAVQNVEGYSPNFTLDNVESDTTYTMQLSASTFYSSEGLVEVFADVLLTNGQTERQMVHSEIVDVLSKRTYVENITVTPAEEPGGEVVVELTYIDENGLWADGELTLYLNGSTEGEAYQAYITEQSSVTTFTLYSGFIDGNMGTITLEFNNGINIVTLLSESFVVKGENFVDEDVSNDSTG